MADISFLEFEDEFGFYRIVNGEVARISDGEMMVSIALATMKPCPYCDQATCACGGVPEGDSFPPPGPAPR